VNRFFFLAGLALLVSGCVTNAPEGEMDEEEAGTSQAGVSLTKGVNGGACYMSPYNCKLRVDGGNRIAHVDGTLDWGVDASTPVLDGNGAVLGLEKGSSLKFNYGQERTFAGQRHVFAMTTSNRSAGWFPLSAVQSSDTLSSRVGDVRAHRAGLAKMHCYEVRDSSDPTLEVKKVVKDTTASPGPSGEAAGDYLPRVRENGKRSVNLIFNVPGSGLGGPAIDHFPAGTRFQRLDVPTDSGRPSLDVPLWLQDGSGHFVKPAGSMKFVYGYVVSKTGETRVGWIAYDALTPSSGCL
jgi:hypothetical protein